MHFAVLFDTHKLRHQVFEYNVYESVYSFNKFCIKLSLSDRYPNNVCSVFNYHPLGRS
jgi:hypothetical protein